MKEGTASSKLGYIDSIIVERLLKFSDFAIFFIMTLGAIMMNQRLVVNEAVLLFTALVFTLFLLLLLRSFQLYQPQNLARFNSSFFKTLVLVMGCGVVICAFTDLLILPLNNTALTYWLIVSFVYLLVSRCLLALLIRPLVKAGRFRKRVAIIGGGKTAETVLNMLAQSPGLQLDIVGIFDDRFDDRSPASLHSYQKIGKIADLATYARHHRVDLAIVAIPLSAEARLLQILKRLWELPIDIRISGQASSLKLNHRAYTYLGKLPLLAVFDRPLHGWGLFLKNVIERSLALVAILLLSPIFILIALAIKLESEGPILFRQKRYGFNNELIEIFKFRSMFIHMSDSHASKLVCKNDPRVTRVGRFIRKTSLDELPQLFNVLTGQLSLVGPRPHATQAKAADALYETVVDGYFARHRVRPGITGWAQIHGWRGETDTSEKIEQRVKYDLDYIDRWSLLLDLYIICKTPFTLLKGENAY